MEQINNSRAKRIESEHALKNEISNQQAFLIVLLNQFFSITLKKQSKKCTITIPTPKIDKIRNANDLIEVKQLSEKQCELICGKDLLTNKTIQRRFTKNKQYFIQNFLIDTLREFGYYFHSKYSKKTSKTIRLERIQNVFFNYRYSYGFDDIQKIGKEVNSYLSDLLQKENSYTLNQNESFLSQFIKK